MKKLPTEYIFFIKCVIKLYINIGENSESLNLQDFYLYASFLINLRIILSKYIHFFKKFVYKYKQNQGEIKNTPAMKEAFEMGKNV